MKTNHTPGPWQVVGHCVATEDYKVVAKTSGNEPILWVGKAADFEVIANARLIAASPDLLSALEYATEALEQLELPKGSWGFEALESARAAIAKAR